MKRLGVALVLCVSACHSGPQIRASGDIIKTDIERARRSNALRCAPRELASAEANLDFALGELDEGNSQRAYEHITEAELASKKAVALSRDCAPRQGVVKERFRPCAYCDAHERQPPPARTVESRTIDPGLQSAGSGPGPAR